MTSVDDPQVLEINSYLRGYYPYMDNWNPVVGQELILNPEPSNYKDQHAVAVLKDDVIVGHVPYNLATCISQFLRREVNKIKLKLKSVASKGEKLWKVFNRNFI